MTSSTSSRSQHCTSFEELVRQWDACVLAITSGARSAISLKQTTQLAELLHRVWEDQKLVSSVDCQLLSHAAKNRGKEWPMACLLRSMPLRTQLCPSGEMSGVPQGFVALSLLCWLASLSGDARWLYSACEEEVVALIAEMTAPAGCGFPEATATISAVAVTLVMYGWSDAVMLLLGRIRGEKETNDVLGFLKRIDTGRLGQLDAQSVPRPPAAVPAPLMPAPAQEEVLLADDLGQVLPPRGLEAPASPMTRARVAPEMGSMASSSPRAPPAAGPKRRASVAQFSTVPAATRAMTEVRRRASVSEVPSAPRPMSTQKPIVTPKRRPPAPQLPPGPSHTIASGAEGSATPARASADGATPVRASAGSTPARASAGSTATKRASADGSPTRASAEGSPTRASAGSTTTTRASADGGTTTKRASADGDSAWASGDGGTTTKRTGATRTKEKTKTKAKTKAKAPVKSTSQTVPSTPLMRSDTASSSFAANTSGADAKSTTSKARSKKKVDAKEPAKAKPPVKADAGEKHKAKAEANDNCVLM